MVVVYPAPHNGQRRANAYRIGDVLVDPLATTPLDGVRAVLLTHSHTDHTSGKLRALLAGLPLIPLDQTAGALPPDWEALHTPGHSADQVSLWNKSTGELLCSDVMHGDGTCLLHVGVGSHLFTHMQQLERLVSMGFERAYPGHGVVMERPHRMALLLSEHRENLEAIREFVKEGPISGARLCLRLSPRLKGCSTAYLQALVEEGSARQDGALYVPS